MSAQSPGAHFTLSSARPVSVRAPFRAILPYSRDVSAESGIVSSVAAPLADAGISIFQLSTYASDYCLVPEEKLSAAIGCLRSAFKVKDVVLLDGNGAASSNAGDDHNMFARHGAGRAPPMDDEDGSTSPDMTARNLGEIEHSTDSSGHRRNGFSVAPYQLFLTSIGREYIDAVTAQLLKLIFYPEKCVFCCYFAVF